MGLEEQNDSTPCVDQSSLKIDSPDMLLATHTALAVKKNPKYIFVLGNIGCHGLKSPEFRLPLSTDGKPCDGL